MDASPSRSKLRHFAKWAVVGAALVLELAVLYVLAYAPFLLARYGADPEPEPTPWRMLIQEEFPADHSVGNHPAFAPVEWLIDEGILAKPLDAWARVCGVASQQEWRAYCRNDFGSNWSELVARRRARRPDRMQGGD